jgi:ABC-type branched-subunit amino acid transport system permease subunit
MTIADWFYSNELLFQDILVNILVGYSLYIVLRAGIFSLGTIGFYAIGGYTTAYLLKQGWSFLGAASVAVLLAAVVSLVLSLVLWRLRALYLGMATIAFNMLVQILALNWTPVTGGTLGIVGIIPQVSTWSLLALVVVIAALFALAERGRSRRTLELMRVDEHLSRGLGVNVDLRRHVIFVLSAALGGLAGSLYASLFFAFQPANIGFSALVSALAVVIIGGTTIWVGPIVGAVIAVSLTQVLEFAGDWRPVCEGLLIVIMAVWAREGVARLAVNGFTWLRDKVRAARAAALVQEG